MSKVGIYKITNPRGCMYIGQSVDIDKRFSAYKRLSCKSQPRLMASLKKYGTNNHLFEILEICLIDDLPKREKFYVDLYKTFNSKEGLNIRDGGGNCARLSDEQKLKISNSLKGVKHSPERVEKNRLGQIGKKASVETRLKQSLNNTKPNLGKKASEETRLKLSLAHKGQQTRLGSKLTDEQKLRMSVRLKGEGNPNYGLKRSVESKNKTAESVRLSWIKRREEGKDHPGLGKKHSVETKKKLSEIVTLYYKNKKELCQK